MSCDLDVEEWSEVSCVLLRSGIVKEVTVRFVYVFGSRVLPGAEYRKHYLFSVQKSVFRVLCKKAFRIRPHKSERNTHYKYMSTPASFGHVIVAFV